MSDIIRDMPPDAALLHRLQAEGVHLDGYHCVASGHVALADYVEAFYTTRLFRLERLILAAVLRRPSTDAQARELAQAQRDDFAAWTVEARAPDQLLLRDVLGSTYSWLMVETIAGDDAGTRLHFGSAVLPVRRVGVPPRLGFVYRTLLGFHDHYSRALLAAARTHLAQRDPIKP